MARYGIANYGKFKTPRYTLDWDRRLLAFDPATLIMSWENYDGRGYLCGVFRGPLAWGEKGKRRLRKRRCGRRLVSTQYVGVKDWSRMHACAWRPNSRHDGFRCLVKNLRGRLLGIGRVEVSDFILFPPIILLPTYDT